LPILSADPTAAFCIKFEKDKSTLDPEESKDKKFHQRFEFAYYNYKRGTTDQYVYYPTRGYEAEDNRYYINPNDTEEGDGTRLPILHTMYLCKDMTDPTAVTFNGLINSECKHDKCGKSISEIVGNLIENNLKGIT
jgi:hypothetical protein